MEIPYIVNARKDTGLNNSKIAIWLFLASEVMLFGGLFSSYIFLRIFADYPWPERALPVLPGLINTFILIASSVTVVFAWAGLKLRKWNMFKWNMAFTILCAAIFMVFKVQEYSGKFNHHGVQTEDYAWLEGHVHYEEGDKTKGNAYAVEADTINFTIESTTPPYLALILEQAGESVPTLADAYQVREIKAGNFTQSVLFPAGTQLSAEVLATANAKFIEARTHNQELRTQLLKDAWKVIKDPNLTPELVGLADFESQVKAAVGKLHEELCKKADANNEFLIANGNMVFNTNGSTFRLPTKWGRISNSVKGEETKVSLLDGTVVNGTAGNSNIDLGYVDGIDFRHLVMKAEEKGLDSATVIAKSPILHLHGEGGDKIRKIWTAHKAWRGFLTAELTAKGLEKNKDLKPTHVDLYRVTWQQMHAYSELNYEITADNWQRVHGDLKPTMLYDVTGIPKELKKKAFPLDVHLERSEVRFDSAFSPKMNNYYAIYFTITGLHGLHIIGGAIVLGYYLFFGRAMFNSNPEWLANRVEVGGLFWHFVDLVWIFVFPIFYLM